MQLKVNIARKQPMLDAATGKSVWGSLGKDGVLPSSPPYSTALFVPSTSFEFLKVLKVRTCMRAAGGELPGCLSEVREREEH